MIRLMKYMTIALSAALLTSAAEARTKLVTLPDRAKMVLSLENPDRTLLYEEREIPLQKGTNLIDFSWNGVTIDPNSVLIEFLDHPEGEDATKMIATGFPPNENALTWQVYSPEARTERIRVSYLLNGITQQASYEYKVNAEETAGDFRQYLLLQNQSGEDLDDTIVRVQLMEDLTRSVDSGEVRRFLANRERQLPFDKLFVTRPSYHQFKGEDGEEVALVYEIANDEESGLGAYKMPDGKMRIFGDDGMGSSIFLGENWFPQTPPGEEAELPIGIVKDVVIKRFLMKDERTNIRRNTNRKVVMFDQIRRYRYEIENFKDKAVTLKVHEPLSGDWEIEEIIGDGVRTEKKSSDELVVTIDLPAPEQGQEVQKKEVIIEFLIKDRFPGEA